MVVDLCGNINTLKIYETFPYIIHITPFYHNIKFDLDTIVLHFYTIERNLKIMANFPHGSSSKWSDITEEFVKSTDTLKVGQLVTSDDFNFYTGVQLLEVS